MEHYYRGEWGSLGSANGQFELHYGIAVDSEGNVYVSDSGNYRIQKFTSRGIFLTQWGSLGNANGQFQWPVGIAVESDDDLVVTDSGNYRIQKFTSDGNFIRKWGVQSIGDNHNTDNSFGGATGIAVDSDYDN